MTASAVLKRVLSFALPIGVAAAIFAFLVQRSEPPKQVPITERETTVRVMEVKRGKFIPSVTGYGTVEPEKSWDAVAQVSGRIVYIHPRLRSGAILPKDTEIIRIDPEDYEIAVRQAKANLDSAHAKLAELEIQQQNAQASLKIEKRSLELTRNDIERKRDLVQRNTVSQLTLDESERVLLSQQTRVQDLENSIRRFPAQINAQREQINVDEAQLENAKLNLQRATIKLPFNARIATVNIEETQFVAAGANIAAADAISGAEIKAEIPQARFRDFTLLTAPPDFKPPQLSDNALAEAIGRIGWTAEVRLIADDGPTKWQARVLRTSDTINPQTRTVGVIVYVDRPYADVQPETKPPLVKGMFVEVKVKGRPIEDVVRLSREYVRDRGTVWVMKDGKLEIRETDIVFRDAEYAYIREGLESGEEVVITTLATVADGVGLRKVGDPSAPSKSSNGEATD